MTCGCLPLLACHLRPPLPGAESHFGDPAHSRAVWARSGSPRFVAEHRVAKRKPRTISFLAHDKLTLMWPKVIAQLFELLPHISRMVPLADKYLSQRSSTDSAVTTLADDVRSDMGRVAKAHVDLANRLDEFAAHVDGVAAETRSTRSITERIDTRTAVLERQLATARALAILSLVATAITLVLLIVLLTRGR